MSEEVKNEALEENTEEVLEASVEKAVEDGEITEESTVAEAVEEIVENISEVADDEDISAADVLYALVDLIKKTKNEKLKTKYIAEAIETIAGVIDYLDTDASVDDED